MTSRLYLGGYTTQDGGGDGIGVAAALPNGIGDAQPAVAAADPSFLALSADGRFLYAVNELDDGRVSAFAVEADGSLRDLGSQPTHGAHPCHLAVDPDGRFVVSANYSSGSVAVHPIAGDGSLEPLAHLVQHEGNGPNAERQDGPHAHMVAFHDGYVFAVDLGTDSVYVYTVDPESGQLTGRSRLQTPHGAGPRHIAFHPSGGTAYVIDELDSTLLVCAYDDGELQLTGAVPTRPEGATGENLPAEVLVSPDGRFVYGSNRGDNTVVVFATSDDGRAVTLVQTVDCGGDWPRHLAFGDGVLYVANERSSTVSALTVDASSGALTPVGTPLPWPKPVCVLPA